jgi:large subunit ribosomal protein L1
VQYRTDKGGIIHAGIGRASFTIEALELNLKALVEALNRAKPQSSKGVYLKKIAVSSTMGIGVRVETSGFSAISQQ